MKPMLLPARDKKIPAGLLFPNSSYEEGGPCYANTSKKKQNKKPNCIICNLDWIRTTMFKAQSLQFLALKWNNVWEPLPCFSKLDLKVKQTHCPAWRAHGWRETCTAGNSCSTFRLRWCQPLQGVDRSCDIRHNKQRTVSGREMGKCDTSSCPTWCLRLFIGQGSSLNNKSCFPKGD